MKQDMSRRAFLGLGAMTAAVAGAGLAGFAPSNNSEKAADGAAAASAGGDVMAFEPSFLTAPAVPSEVKEEKDCDVVVVGYGLAGSAAAKAAAEEGAKVIVIEKQAKNNYSVVSMAGDFGVVGSQIQKDLGIEWAPKEDIVNELMKDMAFRPDPKFLGYWYDHSGEDFDWFIEGADYEVLPTTAANQTTDNPNYIRPKCFPALEGYDWKEEYYPLLPRHHHNEPQYAVGLPGRAGRSCRYGQCRNHVRHLGRTTYQGRERRNRGHLRT